MALNPRLPTYSLSHSTEFTLTLNTLCPRSVLALNTHKDHVHVHVLPVHTCTCTCTLIAYSITSLLLFTSSLFLLSRTKIGLGAFTVKVLGLGECYIVWLVNNVGYMMVHNNIYIIFFL